MQRVLFPPGNARLGNLIAIFWEKRAIGALR